MALWQVETNWTGPSAPLLSTHYFDVGGGGTPQQAANAVSAFWTAVLTQIRVGYVAKTNPEVRQLNEATGALQAVIPVSQATITCNNDGALVDLLQGVATWFTGDVADGRQIKGRTFIPGVTESVNDTAGVPTAAYISAIQTAAAALVADVSSSLQVWHRPLKDAEGNVTRPGSQHDVVSGNASPNWSYLSSRRL
jgi:hypothetical protein